MIIRTTRKKRHGTSYWEVKAGAYVVGAILLDPLSEDGTDSIANPAKPGTPIQSFGDAVESLQYLLANHVPPRQMDDLVDSWDEDDLCCEWDTQSPGWALVAPGKAVA